MYIISEALEASSRSRGSCLSSLSGEQNNSGPQSNQKVNNSAPLFLSSVPLWYFWRNTIFVQWSDFLNVRTYFIFKGHIYMPCPYESHQISLHVDCLYLDLGLFCKFLNDFLKSLVHPNNQQAYLNAGRCCRGRNRKTSRHMRAQQLPFWNLRKKS